MKLSHWCAVAAVVAALNAIAASLHPSAVTAGDWSLASVGALAAAGFLSFVEGFAEEKRKK